MANYVCTELSTPALLTGNQTCKTWSVLEQQSSSIVPDLTTAERDEIILWIVSIFAVVFVVKRIRRMLGS